MTNKVSTQTMLGSIAEFINGGAWNQTEYSEEGVPVVRVTDIKNETVDLSECKFLPKSSFEKYSRHALRQGDLVICTVGSHPTQPGSVVGRAAVIPAHASGALLNQNAVCIRSSSPAVDQGWLGYLGRSPEFRDYIISCARGSASQVRMAIGLLKEMRVNIFPLSTQQRIAGILSAYDELIENSQRRIAILEAMARAIYREWFIHFRFPGHENSVRADSPLGEIPQGWEVKNVRQVAGLVSRGPSLTYVDTDGIQVVNQRCIRNGEIEMQAVQYASPLSKKKSHFYLQKNDVLVNSMGVGTLGRVSRNLSIDEPAIIHNCITLVRAREGDPTIAFLYYRLSDCQEHFESLGVGATGQTSLRIETIEDVHFAFPNVELLSAFEAVVLPMWAQIGVLKKQTQNLRRTRDLLLPRLLSGQIEVDKMPEGIAA